MSDSLPLWISIEGIIGAGKSTFLERIVPILEKYYGKDSILVIPERVDKMIEGGHLSRCMDEPYVTQTFFFHLRILEMLERMKSEKGKKARVIISERSPISDYYIFWKTTCANGLPTELAQKTYPLLWETWVRLLNGMIPALFVYLKLDIQTSQKRMKQRNRESEKATVTTTYQQQLKKAHDNLFGGSTVDLPFSDGIPIKCVTMSSRDDFKNSSEVASSLAERLIEYIDELRTNN